MWCQDLKKQLGHEGGVLMNGISALIEMTPESSLIFLLPYEDTMRRRLSMNQEVGPQDCIY